MNLGFCSNGPASQGSAKGRLRPLRRHSAECKTPPIEAQNKIFRQFACVPRHYGNITRQQRYALMVKRLRRRPLTAESGVRFPMRVPKETGTAMCLFFVYSACGICAQAQLPSTQYQKKQALQCACFFCCNERGIERRVKKAACGQAELFVGICSFAPSLDLGKRRTRAGGFAEGRKRARGQPARHTRAFVY